MMNRLLSVILSVLCVMAVMASENSDSSEVSVPVVRPVSAVYALEAGSLHMCDTYLTPITYTGWNMGFDYTRRQAMRFNPERWIMELDCRLGIGKGENPSHLAEMWNLSLQAGWGMMRRWRPIDGLVVAAGGEITATAGVLYLMRNSNNPASAKASLTLGVTGLVSYDVRLGRLPVTFSYHPALPLTGVFFGVDYDELYYEIWLGNHSGLCHWARPDNYFRLDNLLTADLHFGATTLRLGYRCDVFSSKASGIVSNQTTHSFVIGISTEWISLNRGADRLAAARIISAQ